MCPSKKNDPVILKVIEDLPQLGQVQYATDEQLRHLQAIANKLGLYDASDVIRILLENK